VSTQPQARARLSASQLAAKVRDGEKITMVSCYDASSAALADAAGIEMLLVGDSLGMTVQGHDSTLPVTVDDILYHTKAVLRGCQRPMVIADMPFASYHESPQSAFAHAAKLMAGGAHMVKLEGGAMFADTVRFLVDRGIPVCGHVGLTPQFFHTLGGYKVQGKGEAGDRVLEDALAIEAGGAAMTVVEAVPAALGDRITRALSIPTIGIGAGPGCSGQILIWHDMLDLHPGRKAKFVKNYMAGASSPQAALERFVAEVKSGAFPSPEYCYN
jgi:3-methyl-2-oxobutanoate hydroxymethyltransferase